MKVVNMEIKVRVILKGKIIVGKILLGGKCPFVRTKKLAGQKNCPDKKNVQTKKLSGQKKCPDKKLSGQKNCLDKKIVRTKILTGQKNCPDKKLS